MFIVSFGGACGGAGAEVISVGQMQIQTTAGATTKAKYGDPSLRSRMTTKNKVQQRSNYDSEASTTATGALGQPEGTAEDHDE
jgi:hypothetical protein